MKTQIARTPTAVDVARPRARWLGAAAGLLGIGCCIYPVVLALLGVSTAAEAIALGNRLYGTWGWTFKIAGGVLAVAGIIVQLRRRRQCSVGGAAKNRGFIVRVALIGVVAYWLVYGVTKALAAWGS